MMAMSIAATLHATMSLNLRCAEHWLLFLVCAVLSWGCYLSCVFVVCVASGTLGLWLEEEPTHTLFSPDGSVPRMATKSTSTPATLDASQLVT